MTALVSQLPLALDPLIAAAKRRARQRRSALLIIGVAVAGVVLAVTLMPSPGSGGGGPSLSAKGQSSDPTGGVPRATPRSKLETGYVNYPSEGVRLGPPPRGFVPPVSAADALHLFRGTGFNAFAGALPPSVTLHTMTSRGKTIPVWVVTYRKTRPTYYGPVGGQGKPACDFVGIYNLHASTWKTFFQDCSR